MSENLGPGLDAEFLRHTLGIARQNGYAEVEISIDGNHFAATLSPIAKRVGNAASDAPSIAEAEFKSIDSPCVGYYRPGNVALAIGQSVKIGEIVAVITALGIANDVESKVTGEVVEVLVQANEPVQFGQSLALVRAK